MAEVAECWKATRPGLRSIEDCRETRRKQEREPSNDGLRVEQKDYKIFAEYYERNKRCWNCI